MRPLLLTLYPIKLAVTIAASIAVTSAAMADKSTYDALWSHATLYENAESSFIQKLSFTGRLQWDAFDFDGNEAGSYSSTAFRRARSGFKAKVFNKFTLHGEIDMDLKNTDPVYNRLTDAYLSWNPGKNSKIKVGKQSAGFTLEGATSSKKLITIERSKLAGNIWFTKEYFSGISLSGKDKNWSYKAGLFSNDDGAEFDEVGDEGSFVLLSAGYDFSDAAAVDQASLRLDFVHNKEPDDYDNLGTKKLKRVVSLSGKWQNGDYHIWGELAFANGFDGNDIFGFQIMPFYDLNDTFQIATRYAYVNSSEDNGLGLGRYEKDIVSGKGNELHEFFLGLNTYIYGHKLKWQNGIQYTDMTDDAADGGSYDGWGLTSAVRISW